MKLAILVLALTGFACVAPRAEAAPLILPAHDVVVRYEVMAPGQPPHDYDVSFSADSQRARIDDPVRGLWFLVDFRASTAALVVPQMHAVVTEPDLANLAQLLDQARDARFTPLGRERIAGLSCTRYLVLTRDATGTACLTNSGVALSVSGQDARGSAHAKALSVAATPVPPRSLLPPEGYSTLALPPGMIAALLGSG